MTSALLHRMFPTIERSAQERTMRSVSERYEAEAFGDAEFILTGPDFDFKIVRDRSQVFAYVSLLGKGDWHYLQDAVAFISGISPEEMSQFEKAALLSNADFATRALTVHYAELSRLMKDESRIAGLREFEEQKRAIRRRRR